MRLPALALLLAAPLAAQTVAPRTITFTGAPNLPADALLTLSGLHPGTTLTQPDIEAAMNRMADTGLFADIRFTTTPAALAFTLTPQDAAHMRPVAFTNFPWYTTQQLTEALHQQLPLFTGNVPVEGDLAQRAATALEAILQQNQSLKATIQFLPGPGGLDYFIATPPITVGKLLIDDARLDSAPSLIDVQSRFAEAIYLTGVSEQALRQNLSDAYLDLGYLDQHVDPITHAAPRRGNTRVLVDLTGTAHPGEQYKVSQLTLPPPTGTVTQAELDQSTALKVGAPTSVTYVTAALAHLDFTFVNHGYLDAATTVVPTKNSQAHTIAYAFHTSPGPVYTMRSLVFATALVCATAIDPDAGLAAPTRLVLQWSPSPPPVCTHPPRPASAAITPPPPPLSPTGPPAR